MVKIFNHDDVSKHATDLSRVLEPIQTFMEDAKAVFEKEVNIFTESTDCFEHMQNILRDLRLLQFKVYTLFIYTYTYLYVLECQ